MADTDYGIGSGAKIAQDAAKQIQSSFGKSGGQNQPAGDMSGAGKINEQLNTPYPSPKGG